jgi:hypothetical protein
MIQTLIPIEGQLATCRCGKQPKHWLVRGKDQHFLECAPCNVRTQKYGTFQEAIEAWEAQERLSIFTKER